MNTPHFPAWVTSATQRHRTVLATALAATATVLAPLSTAPATAAGGHHRAVTSQVVTQTVDSRLFGVHDAHLSSLSRSDTGSIRLWDSYTEWRDVQPDAGVLDLERLDHIVDLAHANGTEVTLVVAMTPKFAAADPTNPAYATTMPRISAYKQYVAALMSHYRDYFGPGQSGIANYQVWNEANIDTFWTGTPAQMAQLTQAMWQVRNRVDPGVSVIGPALEARMPYQQKWVHRYVTQVVGGKPVWSYMDAMSLNLYPLARYGDRLGGPEDSMGILDDVRRQMAADGVPASLPLWNTEVNYGLESGGTGMTPAVPVASDLQIAYVMRTYLLNAANGVQRVFWYAYDMGNLPADRGGQPLANTLLTSTEDRTSLTEAGEAFGRIQTWMSGSLVSDDSGTICPVDAQGTYTCEVAYSSGAIGRVYWNPDRRARVRVDPTARAAVDEHGTAVALSGRSVTVGYAPVLVLSAQ